MRLMIALMIVAASGPVAPAPARVSKGPPPAPPATLAG